MTDPRLQVCRVDDGEAIHYLDIGQGRPIVILHGWTSNHQEWLSYAEALAEDYRVLAWDARGHSDHHYRSGSTVTVQRMADDLHRLIEHNSLQRPILVGHSMGALTIWEYIARHGDGHLGGLCLIDQSPKLVTDDNWRLGIYGNFSIERNRAFIDHLRTDFAEAVLQLAANGNNPRTAESYRRNTRGFQRLRQYLKTLQAEPLTECWASLTAADYRELLPRITVPVLLVYGDLSTFYSTETARYVHDRIPDNRLFIYEGTDHSPHLWQRDRFIDDLRSFADRLNDGSVKELTDRV